MEQGCNQKIVLEYFTKPGHANYQPYTFCLLVLHQKLHKKQGCQKWDCLPCILVLNEDLS